MPSVILLAVPIMVDATVAGFLLWKTCTLR
jgi:hypothetical protein